MAILSITGCPGVGKSFLAKQLGSALSAAIFLEGEEGTIPSWVFEDVFSGGSPVKRWEFFIQRYNTIFSRAKQISQTGVPTVLDVNEHMVSVLLGYEKEEYVDELLQLANDSYNPIRADVTLFITVSKDSLQEFIKTRGRSSEQNDKMIKRSMYIQDKLKSILEGRDDVILVPRDEFDFSKEEDMNQVLQQIQKWL